MNQYNKTVDVIKKYISNKNEKLKIFPNIDSMGIEDLLLNLNRLFGKEEEKIKKEQDEAFRTDNYENDVRAFAIELVRTLLPHHNELGRFKEYKKLLSQRHIAYSFYHLHSIYGTHLENLNTTLNDVIYNKNLYLGLVEFYRLFYGKFHDNEEAIELLCEYYPKNIDLSNERDGIVNALFRHITNAGIPGDNGFAFKGIEIIEEYIGNLPKEIIELLLNKYELSNVIYNKVYRRQIIYIIEHSLIPIEMKKIYKFHYIDSILLANKMNIDLYDKYRGNNSQPYYLSLQENFSQNQINVIKHKETDKVRAYWTNNISGDRAFKVDEKSVITIQLQISHRIDQICIVNKKNPVNKIYFLFKYFDWTLDDYQSKETDQKLLNFIDKNNSEINYRSLTFALLYLNNFRGMNNQLIDFDHKFKYSSDTNKIEKSSIDYVIPHFYSKNIYSLTCIVGKNGTGKTSTIDFLREKFFILINLVNSGNLSCENGVLKDVNNNILEENCEFLVVFYLGNEPYYLTNISNIENVSGISIKPFKKYRYENELSKVAYFSNMLSSNLDNIYINSTSRKNEENSVKFLKNFRQIDYSEAASFIERRERESLDGTKKYKDKEDSTNNNQASISKEICYYISFLHNLSSKSEISFCLDFLEEKKIEIKSDLIDKSAEIPLDTKIKVEEMIDIVKPFLLVPDSKLGHFSSGQYAKFSFLAKLYWLLEGYRKYNEVFEKMLNESDKYLKIDNLFSDKDAILEDETAIIFIDEGELYYHPEWQRLYIKTLIDIIRNTDIRCKLQIVLTTNSPFIISDILNEDIIYLAKGNKLFDRTLGQNIHKLLKGNFFMSYTIGEYSRELINNIINWLSQENDNANLNEQTNYYFGEDTELKSEYNKIYYLINEIGEPVYREKLLSTLNKSDKYYKETRLEELSKQLAKIEGEIKKLEES